MRKLILTCDSCGQRMQVPRSAIGRTGMCPSCGDTIKIRSHNTTTTSPAKRSGILSGGGNWWRSSGTQPTEDAKRKFGEAVDLFYGGRYAESLAIFDALVQQFPGNPDIENGRQQCLQALRKPQDTFALEDKSGRVGAGGFGSTAPPPEGGLDKDTVRRIVIEKMLRSPNEAVQLQAADLAARLLGMLEEPEAEDEAPKQEEPAKAEIEDDLDEEEEDFEVDEDEADDDLRSSNVVDL